MKRREFDAEVVGDSYPASILDATNAALDRLFAMMHKPRAKCDMCGVPISETENIQNEGRCDECLAISRVDDHNDFTPEEI